MESGKITTGHFVAGSPNRPNSEWLTLNEILALLTCIALIVILGWICRYRMNPDAVALFAAGFLLCKWASRPRRVRTLESFDFLPDGAAVGNGD